MSVYMYPAGEHYYYPPETHQQIMDTLEKVKVLEQKIESVRNLINNDSYCDEASNAVVQVKDLLKALDGENTWL